MSRKCEENADMVPSCYPDQVEDRFIELKRTISAALTVEGVECAMEEAVAIKKACMKTPFTKNFIKKAYNEIVNAANERIQNLRGHKSNVIAFSAKKTSTALAAVEDELRKRKRHGGFWL